MCFDKTLFTKMAGFQIWPVGHSLLTHALETNSSLGLYDTCLLCRSLFLLAGVPQVCILGFASSFPLHGELISSVTSAVISIKMIPRSLSLIPGWVLYLTLPVNHLR